MEVGLFGQVRRDQRRTALDGKIARRNFAALAEPGRAHRVQFIDRRFGLTLEKLLVVSGGKFRRLLLQCGRPNRFGARVGPHKRQRDGRAGGFR